MKRAIKKIIFIIRVETFEIKQHIACEYFFQRVFDGETKIKAALKSLIIGTKKYVKESIAMYKDRHNNTF